MIFLFLFGSPVEDILGRWRYLLFYLLGGLMAALAQIALSADHFDSEIPMGGASGAISACMGGFLPLFLHSKIRFRWVFFLVVRFWSGEFELKAWFVMSWWFLKDAISALLTYDRAGGGVAFGAHAGGWIGGLGMALLFRWLLKRGLVRNAALEAARADALAADELLVHILDGERQLGPLPVSNVLDMVRLGSIGEHALFWCEGMTDWMPLSKLPRSLG